MFSITYLLLHNPSFIFIRALLLLLLSLLLLLLLLLSLFILFFFFLLLLLLLLLPILFIIPLISLKSSCKIRYNHMYADTMYFLQETKSYQRLNLIKELM